MTELAAIREAVLQALPADTSYSGGAPPPEHLYVPPPHHKALRPECQLVVGTRGVGKSVWTRALHDQALRRLVGSSIPQLDRAEIRIGYAERPQPDDYPDAEMFAQLLGEGFDAYTIWRTVVIRWVADIIKEPVPQASWRESVSWVAENPESVTRMMTRASGRLVDESSFGLILFDALDRLSGDWHTMDRIVRDLLRIALWLKPFPNLSAKVFLREDQLERTVTDFPDASKLLATKSELNWAPHDLHGLLWQYLLNGPGARPAVRRIRQAIWAAAPHRCAWSGR